MLRHRRAPTYVRESGMHDAMPGSVPNRLPIGAHFPRPRHLPLVTFPRVTSLAGELYRADKELTRYRSPACRIRFSSDHRASASTPVRLTATLTHQLAENHRKRQQRKGSSAMSTSPPEERLSSTGRPHHGHRTRPMTRRTRPLENPQPTDPGPESRFGSAHPAQSTLKRPRAVGTRPRRDPIEDKGSHASTKRPPWPRFRRPREMEP